MARTECLALTIEWMKNLTESNWIFLFFCWTLMFDVFCLQIIIRFILMCVCVCVRIFWFIFIVNDIIIIIIIIYNQKYSMLLYILIIIMAIIIKQRFHISCVRAALLSSVMDKTGMKQCNNSGWIFIVFQFGWC